MRVGFLCAAALAASLASANEINFLREFKIDFRSTNAGMQPMGDENKGDNKETYFFVRPGYARHDNYNLGGVTVGLVKQAFATDGVGSYIVGASWNNFDPDGGNSTDFWNFSVNYQLTGNSTGAIFTPYFVYGETENDASLLGFGLTAGAKVSERNDVYGEFSVGYQEIDNNGKTDGAVYDAALRGRLPIAFSGIRSLYLQTGYSWPTEAFGAESYYVRGIIDVNASLGLWLTARKGGELGVNVNLKF